MAQEGINTGTKVLWIGGSAGSIEALLTFLPAMKRDISFAVVIVVHRRHDTESQLGELLQMRSGMPVREVEDKEAMLPGIIYLAPANYHLLLEKDGTFSLDISEKINYSRPSIDVTFESAADVYGAQAVGLLLSGSNSDGTEGLKRIKAAGGKVIIQLPSSAEVSYMPQQALKEMEADAVLTSGEMAGYINSLVK